MPNYDRIIVMLNSIMQLFSGKKTYIVGGLMIALGLLTQDNQLVLEGLGIITLRAGVSKSKG